MNTLATKTWPEMSVDEALSFDMQVFKAMKSFNLMGLRAGGVYAVVERLNLEPFLEFVAGFSTSNGLPYHNFYHTMCMLLNCYEGAYHEALDEDEARGLCAAALLHDFCHSGGHEPDEVNIATAIDGLYKAQRFAESKLLPLNEKAFGVAKSCVAITKYPYEQDPKTITEMIIRDADLMQLYEESPEDLLVQYLGLKTEIEVSRGSCTMHEFIEGSKVFHDSMVWHTKWATEKTEARNLLACRERLYALLSQSDPQKHN